MKPRPISNPPSPWLSADVEWLEPHPARLEIFADATREIPSRNDSPGLGFTWSVNPYRGCLHARAYCCARAYHEYLGYGAGTDFETRLVVKLRAPELLRAAFERPGWRGEPVAFSGGADAWQPLEAAYPADPPLPRGLRRIPQPGLRRDQGGAAGARPGPPRPAARRGPPGGGRQPAVPRRGAGPEDRAGSLLAGAPPAAHRPPRRGRPRPHGAGGAGDPRARRRAAPRPGGGALTDDRVGRRLRGAGPCADTIAALFRATCERLGFAEARFGREEHEPRTFRRPGRGAQLDLL